MTVQEAVDNGIRLLDEKYPGWEGRVDLNTLDVSNSACCVLKQVTGDYAEACQRLFGPNVLDVNSWVSGELWAPHVHGFALFGSAERWSTINDEWQARIRARRALQGAETEAREFAVPV